MGVHEFAKHENQDKNSYEASDEDKDRLLLALDNTDKSGNQRGDATNRSNNYWDGKQKIVKECFATPLSRSHEQLEHCKKEDKGNNEPNCPFTE